MFKNRLYEVLFRKGITHKELAKRTGVSRSYVTGIANHRLLPGPKLAGLICKALKLKERDVFPDYQLQLMGKLEKHIQVIKNKGANHV